MLLQVLQLLVASPQLIERLVDAGDVLSCFGFFVHVIKAMHRSIEKLVPALSRVFENTYQLCQDLLRV